jgi:5-methylcytosine-specific restriction protein B
LSILEKIRSEVIAVSIAQSIKNVDAASEQDLYDATRYAWKIDDTKVKNIKYVVGVRDQKARIIIKITEMNKVNENTIVPNSGKPETSSDIIGKRYYFDGEINPKEYNGILGKDITPFFGKMNASIRYPENNGNVDITNSISLENEENERNIPLNQILYGPPGTGKTYLTIDKALEVVDEQFYQNNKNDRKKLKEKFEEYREAGQIEFVTFHQSYGYEEFVEGIKPIPAGKAGNEVGNDMIYDIVDGAFKIVCERSKEKTFAINKEIITKSRKIWKISLGGSGIQEVKTKCFADGEIRVKWAEVKNVNDNEFNKLGPNDQRSIKYFINEMDIGDFVVSLGSESEIDGIGIIESDFSQDNYREYSNVRKVNWLISSEKINIKPINEGCRLDQKTVYKLNRFKIEDLLELLRSKNLELKNDNSDKKYVLIIDEINRGNISKIFGELITLIETSKRAGNEEAMAVTLPYSGGKFSVPNNLYIIGTMNTADRSIALMDTALRRRFEFVEMMPEYDQLSDNVDSVNLQKLLKTINQRIEYLYDRDHTIGHAYFMGIKTLTELNHAFANKIIPLLQEYFYDDWEKIRLVLADNQKNGFDSKFIIGNDEKATSLFGTNEVANIEPEKIIYTINEDLAKGNLQAEAFIKIYDVDAMKVDQASSQE